MKNIRNIFLRDISKLSNNVIAIIVILGITILPSLYAWFNIAALWSPYDNTGDLPVAVVNKDKGTSLKGIRINVGEKLEKELKSNKKMQWNFVDFSNAKKGIDSGKYYAIIELPSDFSLSMISFATGKLKRPYINYYVNEKKNGIAPKITDAGIKSIQSQVNSNFVATLATYITDAIKVGSENATITRDDIKNSLDNSIDDGISSLSSLQDSISAFEGNISSLKGIFIASKTLTDSVDNSLTSLENKVDEGLSKIEKEHKSIDKDVIARFPIIDTEFNKVESKLTNLSNSINGAENNVSNSGKVFSSLSNTMDSSVASLKATNRSIENTKNKLEKIKKSTDKLNISQNFIDILNEAIKNPKEVGNFLSSPTEIKYHSVYRISNYGSAMSPFYTTLAIWVGGIIMVAIMKTKVEEDKKIKNVTLRQAYLGRFPIFCIIGLLQSLIISLGDLFFLQIQSTNPVIFVFTCLAVSFIFTLIIYTLTVSFGNIGKAIAVIWLVIQVAGSGGTFPIEVLPNSYKFLSNFMPFTFAIDAMRETTGGIYMENYMIDMLKLSVFIPLSLLLGLILRNPLYRLNIFFEERLEETDFMG